MCFIIQPLTFVDITVSVNESSATVGLIIRPITFIKRVILPYLFSFSVSDTVGELSDIAGTTL
jgi:hypothetical protein